MEIADAYTLLIKRPLRECTLLKSHIKMKVQNVMSAWRSSDLRILSSDWVQTFSRTFNLRDQAPGNKREAR